LGIGVSSVQPLGDRALEFVLDHDRGHATHDTGVATDGERALNGA
jgi:hypothetical protein